MWLDNLKKLIDNLIMWIRSIYEEEVIVWDSSIHEVSSIIFDIVETDYFIDPYVIEDINILLRVLAISVLGISIFNWTHESHEFSRNDPV